MSFYSPKRTDTSKKANAMKVHAQKRAKERLGENVSVYEIAKQIREGQAQFLYRQSRRITHHIVEVEGKPIIVVYDSKRNSVVTFLFPNEGE